MAKGTSFDHLIGLLYDAATAPEQWSPALAILGDALGGCAFVMSMLPSGRGGKFVTGARISPYSRGLLERRYARPETNPLVAAMPRLPETTLVAREAILSNREYLRGELYNEVFRCQGLVHAAAACVLRAPECTVPLGVLRRARSSRPDRHDLELLGRLLPHMRRSIELYLRLGALEARGSAAEETLDCMPYGLILLDAAGTVLFLNRAAEALIGAVDGLTVSGGTLRAVRPRDTVSLHRLISEAIATATGKSASGGGAISLARAEARRPLNVLVTPAPRRHHGVLCTVVDTNRPAVVVVVTDPEASPVPAEDVLKQLYGLTKAEAALATALVNGTSPKEHAERTRTSVETARWHLKNIFLKTGTCKQTELVRLILEAAPLGK